MQTIYKHLEDNEVKWHIQHGLPNLLLFYGSITGLVRMEAATNFIYLDFRKILPSL